MSLSPTLARLITLATKQIGMTETGQLLKTIFYKEDKLVAFCCTETSFQYLMCIRGRFLNPVWTDADLQNNKNLVDQSKTATTHKGNVKQNILTAVVLTGTPPPPDLQTLKVTVKFGFTAFSVDSNCGMFHSRKKKHPIVPQTTYAAKATSLLSTSQLLKVVQGCAEKPPGIILGNHFAENDNMQYQDSLNALKG